MRPELAARQQLGVPRAAARQPGAFTCTSNNNNFQQQLKTTEKLLFCVCSLLSALCLAHSSCACRGREGQQTLLLREGGLEGGHEAGLSLWPHRLIRTRARVEGRSHEAAPPPSLSPSLPPAPARRRAMLI